ncbi:HD domain-containing protein [candidate division KSB1 bacterium]|nr:HD domain-containing protein [candidate division KSB1 bacterium]
METKFINELQPGDRITAFYILRKMEIKTKKDSSDIYASFELGDKTGRIRGTLWNDVKQSTESLKAGDVVKVQGVIARYEESDYINIRKIRKSIPQDNVEKEQFLPRAEKDTRMLMLRLFTIIDSIKHSQIKKLLTLIFDDIDFKNAFSKSPAAKLWHHSYLGGLLEHTLNVVDICDKVLGNYERINRDILIAGALLHDIGKIDELSADGYIEYTDPGRLIGHTVLGCQMVAKRISALPDFPTEIANQIQHLILSHHGSNEQGAPVVPMTLEAIVLHCADFLDSQANAFLRVIKREKGAGGKWSKYVNLIDRFIYLGDS